jgi:hypothetical protein
MRRHLLMAPSVALYLNPESDKSLKTGLFS